MKIALASSDGLMINEHFGKCGRFTIVDAKAEPFSYQVTEIRDVAPICGIGGHEAMDVDTVVSLLKDCHYVLVSRIGIWAQAELKKNGVQAIEIPGFIETGIQQVLMADKQHRIDFCNDID